MAEAAATIATAPATSIAGEGSFFPRSPADLTPDKLNRLACFGNARIASVATEPVGQGVGVLCQLARLRLSYERGDGVGPASVIAKFPTLVEQTRQVVRSFKFYEREVAFYRNLASKVSLATPRPLHAAHDAASDDFLLLLEDLGERRLGDQLNGCSAEDAMLAVRLLADFHAQWWESPKLGALEWMPTSDSDLNKGGLMLYPFAWPMFFERFGSKLPSEFKSIGERLSGQLAGMLDRFRDRPRTVCHGDFRLDNLFFGTKPSHPPLTAVDWQIAVKSTGTYDVGYFASQSLAPSLRRDIEVDLLRTYHDRLVELGIGNYSFADCIDDYRWTQIFCFCYPVIAGGLGDLGNERGVALIDAMTARSVASIKHWKADELLSQ
jgi:hypothetical protein